MPKWVAENTSIIYYTCTSDVNIDYNNARYNYNWFFSTHLCNIVFVQPLECSAGTLVLLHNAVVHYSEENVSEKTRHAYSIHIIDGKEGNYNVIVYLCTSYLMLLWVSIICLLFSSVLIRRGLSKRQLATERWR